MAASASSQPPNPPYGLSFIRGAPVTKNRKREAFRLLIMFSRFRSRRPKRLVVVASSRLGEPLCGFGFLGRALRRKNRRDEGNEFSGKGSTFSYEACMSIQVSKLDFLSSSTYLYA